MTDHLSGEKKNARQWAFGSPCFYITGAFWMKGNVFVLVQRVLKCLRGQRTEFRQTLRTFCIARRNVVRLVRAQTSVCLFTVIQLAENDRVKNPLIV